MPLLLVFQENAFRNSNSFNFSWNVRFRQWKTANRAKILFSKVLAGPEWLSTETVALSELSRKVFDITAKFCCKKSKLLNSICGNRIVVANESKIDNVSAIVLSVKSRPKRGLLYTRKSLTCLESFLSIIKVFLIVSSYW